MAFRNFFFLIINQYIYIYHVYTYVLYIYNTTRHDTLGLYDKMIKGNETVSAVDFDVQTWILPTRARKSWSTR